MVCWCFGAFLPGWGRLFSVGPDLAWGGGAVCVVRAIRLLFGCIVSAVPCSVLTFDSDCFHSFLCLFCPHSVSVWMYLLCWSYVVLMVFGRRVSLFLSSGPLFSGFPVGIL